MGVGGPRASGEDSIAVLLLRGRLEGFELEEHARSLLAIPRVIALEASRKRPPALIRTVAPLRQARRLTFPGRMRLIVLYHPAQYPLARALRDRHPGTELWYVESEGVASRGVRRGEDEELREFDLRARERATAILSRAPSTASVQDDALRERLRELAVISPYAFTPTERRRRSGR